MTNFVYDAGALIAADRGDRWMWSRMAARVLHRTCPLVPAPVVAQVSRSPRQAVLRRFLANCAIVPMTERDAHEAGRLLAATGTSDIVDAVVVITAIRHKAAILTSDIRDIERLVSAAGHNILVIPL